MGNHIFYDIYEALIPNEGKTIFIWISTMRTEKSNINHIGLINIDKVYIFINTSGFLSLQIGF